MLLALLDEASPEVKGFLGAGVFGALTALAWGVRWAYSGWGTFWEDRRKKKLENATDELVLAEQDDKVARVKEERERRATEMWKTQFVEQEARYKAQIEGLEDKRDEDHAEYNHRLVGYQGELANANARIKVLEAENVRCNETATAQAVRIGGLEDRIYLILEALKSRDIDLKLEWMRPKPLTVTTTVIQTEVPSPHTSPEGKP